MKSSLQAYLSDTGGRGRTGTPLRALDFESSASANSATPACFEVCDIPFCCYGKAVTGFEPVIEVLQTCALPLGYTAEMLLFEKNWASWIRTNE